MWLQTIIIILVAAWAACVMACVRWRQTRALCQTGGNSGGMSTNRSEGNVAQYSPSVAWVPQVPLPEFAGGEVEAYFRQVSRVQEANGLSDGVILRHLHFTFFGMCNVVLPLSCAQTSALESVRSEYLPRGRFFFWARLTERGSIAKSVGLGFIII